MCRSPTDGINPGIFSSSIPTATHVARAETEDEQVEALIKAGKAFSASGQWNMCDSRIGNAGVTLKAQKKQRQLNDAARLLVVNKKSELQDWGDIIRWVLPEAKVTFRLKDLKKKDQILEKLATLPKDWTTYIPACDDDTAIPAIPTTTM
jgi:hypothetical protein